MLEKLNSVSTKTLENMELSLKLRTEVGDQQEIALSYFLEANVYFYYRIDWDHSRHCTQKALELAKQSNFKSLMSLCLTRLGDFPFFGSELDGAYYYYNKALEVAKEIGYKRGITFSLGGLSYFYEQKGDIERALKFAEESVNISKNMGDQFGIIEHLDTCFWFSIDNDDYKRAEHYFSQMEQIHNFHYVKMDKVFLQLNKALLLKSSGLANKQALAKEILLKIIEEKSIFEATIFFEATYRALVNLCDILLKEIRRTHNLDLLNDIKYHINQMLIISKNAKSYWWLAETYLLQAKLDLVTLDLKKAKNSLIQAHSIAKNHGLVQLSEKILTEQMELEDQLDKWESLRRTKATITELIDLAQIDDQLIRMIKRRYSLDK